VGLPRLSPANSDRVGRVADFYRMRRSHLTSSWFIIADGTAVGSRWTSEAKAVSGPSNSFARNNLRARCRNCRNGSFRRKLLKTMERETGIGPANEGWRALDLATDGDENVRV
jgi:hypothetical protein